MRRIGELGSVFGRFGDVVGADHVATSAVAKSRFIFPARGLRRKARFASASKNIHVAGHAARHRMDGVSAR